MTFYLDDVKYVVAWKLPNNRFQRIETADSFSSFCGKFTVLCFSQVCPMRFQPLKRALALSKTSALTAGGRTKETKEFKVEVWRFGITKVGK